MNKDAVQFILSEGHKTSLYQMSKMFGVSVKRIRHFMRINKIEPYHIQRQRHTQIAAETRSKTNETRSEENKEYDSTPWPRPYTDMSVAMRGKSYGGNISAFGTKNPTKVCAVHNLNFGTIKSSMG